MAENKHLKLLALFFIALLLFNYPIIGLFSTTDRFFGLPSLFLYIFIVWLFIILLTRWMIASDKTTDSDL